MVAIKVFDNVGRPLVDLIRERLAAADSVNIAVAFLRRSGLRLIETPFARLLDRGARAECILGFDYVFTEPEALATLSEWSGSYPNFRFFAFPTSVEDGGGYHPKLYVFRQADDTHVIIGSSNLTRGGLRSNVEANALISGTRADQPILQAERLYRHLRGQDALFTPDAEYLEGYADLYKTWRAARKREGARAAIERLRANLEARQDALPGTVPTQRQLVAEAIRSLRSSPDDFVRLRDIAAWVENEARSRGMDYKWNTLANSIRGRLNEHTMGKGGEDLFDRLGGVQGRYGRYRLSEKGERLQVRRTTNFA